MQTQSNPARAAHAHSPVPSIALVLLCLSVPIRAAQTDIAGPSGSVAFGTSVSVLPNGNIVVVDPNRTVGANANAGAVYLYTPTGALINTFTGIGPGDTIGSGGVVILNNGNFVVSSPNWSGTSANAGAVTWVNGNSGLAAGVVAPGNSLVGEFAADAVSASSGFVHGVVALPNGNYVVTSNHWNGDRGAVTLCDGASGATKGLITAQNSLIGTNAGDQVGIGGITLLTNGNYVVRSYFWNANIGAATWINAAANLPVGQLTLGNSLRGTAVDDFFGSSVTALSNGNYVVVTPYWHSGLGAATWGDGSNGTAGFISSSNAFIGSTQTDSMAGTTGDYVGLGGVIALTNGDYVVSSRLWNGQTGAATWGDGTRTTAAIVSPSNSLFGSAMTDQVGSKVTALSNGNYVVGSPAWMGTVGAATWSPGTHSSGQVIGINSLTGSSTGDSVGNYGIFALSNGNYVVASAAWSNGMGAVTWASGVTGLQNTTVSASNSLTGAAPNDLVGAVVAVLTNGNYVIGSPGWSGNLGAVTWVNGAASQNGMVGSANSLIGSAANDRVGARITALTNGNYVVQSRNWNGNIGAVTWANGTISRITTVSTRNSLVGTAANDQVGAAFALSDGNYVVQSAAWNGGIGAVTLASGKYRLVGAIQAWNSVIGSAANGGTKMVYAYDASRQQLAVGRPADNIVSLFTMDQIFADGIEP